MMMDCVAGETYFGVRALDDVVVLCAGTVIVKRADAATGADPVGETGVVPVVGVIAATPCVPPPPEQLHSPHKTISARARRRIEVLRLPARSAY
jgi:hypothetical protein